MNATFSRAAAVATALLLPLSTLGGVAHSAPETPPASGLERASDVVVDPDGTPLKRRHSAPSGALKDSSGGGTAAAATVNRYDVHVLAVNTPKGSHGTTAAESRAVVDRLDAEYDRETAGAYRFRYKSFQTFRSGEAPCSVKAWRDLLSKYVGAVAPSSGAVDATWVVVAEADCEYAGQAFLQAPGIHMLPAHWRADGPQEDTGEIPVKYLDVAVLAHEVGHNLGLRHAMGQAAHQGERFPEPGLYEYGSLVSVMGDNNHAMRFGPAELAELGVADRRRTVAAVQREETFTIVPMSAAAGVTTVVVPLGDASHTYITYRDGMGADWPTKYGTVVARDDVCGYGADGEGDEDCEERHERDYLSRVKAAQGPIWTRRGHVGVFVDSAVESPERDSGADVLPLATARPAGLGLYSNERQGFVTGEVVPLGDGVRVEVLGVSPLGATVRVVRPPDVHAPSFGSDNTARPCAAFAKASGKAKECTVVGRSASAHLAIGYDAWDDTAVVAAGVDVDGVTIKRRDWGLDRPRSWQSEGRYLGANVTLKTGTHTVSRWVRDAAGKVTRSTSTVTVRPSTTPGKVRKLKAGKVTRSTAKLTWTKPSTAPGGVKDYVVTMTWRDAKGKHTKTYRDGVRARSGAKLTKLRPGTKYKVSVRTKTAHGASAATNVRFRTKR